MKKILLVLIFTLLFLAFAGLPSYAIVITAPENIGDEEIETSFIWGYVPPQNDSEYTYFSFGGRLKYGLSDTLDIVVQLDAGKPSTGSTNNPKLLVGLNKKILESESFSSFIQGSFTTFFDSNSYTFYLYSQNGFTNNDGTNFPYLGIGFNYSGNGTSWMGTNIGYALFFTENVYLNLNINYFFNYSTGSTNIYTLSGGLSYKF